MAMQQINAVSSFADLLDNLPQWREQVANLVKHTTQKHEDFRAEYVRLVHKAKPRRVKSDSICSIHTNDADEPSRSTPELPSSIATPPHPTEISPLENGNQYIYAQANRKRKPGTSLRSGASGPSKLRSRQMLVIHYDSHAQEQLESIIKSLSACRNKLRKGRMTYTVSKGLQLPKLHRTWDHRAPSSPASLPSLPKSRSPSPLMSVQGADASLPPEPTPQGEAAFMRVDKELESCQNLCETAAHQLLRDGDCRLELNKVLMIFGDVLSLAKLTYEVFKSEDEMQSTTEVPNDGSADSMHTVSDSTLADKPSIEHLQLSSKMAPVLSIPPLGFQQDRPLLNSTTSAPALTAEIEVDDDSDASSIVIDMSRFRTNRPRPAIRPPV